MRKGIVRSLLMITTILALVSGLLIGQSPATTHAAGATCKVDYSLPNIWPGGFTANLTITNLSSTPLNGWTLGFTFPGDQSVGQGWSANWSQSGKNVTAQSLSWNSTIAPNGSTTIGFNGVFTNDNTSPTAFTINGAACNGIPPTVALTSPTSGSSFQAPANIPLQATASDSNGTITRVEFYNGSSLFGAVTSSPYTYSWNNVAAGSYSLTAVAYSSDGLSATSAPVTITVTQPVTPQILTSTASLNVVQGNTASLGISLSKQPASNVVVSVAASGATGVKISAGSSLTFTPANWNTQQTVIIGADNTSTIGSKATITASASGYADVTVTATVVSGGGSGGQYTQRFLDLYNDIKNPANGYFSSQGIPYHSVETLIVEAPDYGHETTSETFSYWLWLEATYGEITGSWKPFNDAWTTMETYMIPSHADQPTNAGYNANSPAQYAPESVNITDYPAQLDSSVSVGQDPLAAELQQAYGTPDVYGMHWLLDTDNWYGNGHCGDGTTKPSYINSYQRGASESVWKTVVQPDCDTFKYGGPNGFLDLFTKNVNNGAYSQQWKYTDAPDADARVVQAAYWAYMSAAAQGKSADIAGTVAKAAKMGDYLRYSFFDKYFKNPGCQSSSCPAGTGKSSSNYLLSWYYAWGGALPASGTWAWRIGSSASHQGYQNPLAAWALSTVSALKPLSPTAASDWSKSLSRQLEFYRWLQSSEGGIAGGATNSWEGHYGIPPAGDPTFYGLSYDWQPEYHDPPSNNWFGYQAWSMERVAEYYHETGDASAKTILDKWIAWALANTKLNSDGTYAIPSTLNWTGQPDTWNASNPGANAGLHVSVVDYTTDVGVTAALAKTFMYYAAKSGDSASQTTAKALLDRMWTNYRDSIGVSNPEVRTDYSQFNDSVSIPAGWTGKNGQGATLNSSTTFLTERPNYVNDPAWPKVNAYLNGGAAPTFTYHRFWAQADIALANADYGLLFPNS
ncbi:glycoside hydrolase family 48 protein [Tengunoibacter tsumagoiensis]|uniref:Cellulose 1,4-beta-cellobiosidase n=1 Tax=Tengunoibacter tsumagoiensis TaxID=2014871 RepID=A0A402A6T8_9CHLR|nr:glycoside hydrolase family 48 protein [Tengunoibacter tsumagoiensis]GCE14844.1 cellulose 1,4-beta-cellobiosidase [Tengunoibacter tsumagoiensis]